MTAEVKKYEYEGGSSIANVIGKKIETTLFDILERRQKGKTCCPSEVARKVDPKKWRDLMPLTRDVARKLRSEGCLEICQGGCVLTSDSWTGPIRLRLPSKTLSTCNNDDTERAPKLTDNVSIHLTVEKVDANDDNDTQRTPECNDYVNTHLTVKKVDVIEKRGVPKRGGRIKDAGFEDSIVLVHECNECNDYVNTHLTVKKVDVIEKRGVPKRGGRIKDAGFEDSIVLVHEERVKFNVPFGKLQTCGRKRKHPE